MFRDCKNIGETKVLFRKLAVKLHPDHGGEDELMILLIKCYNETCIFFESRDGQKKEKKHDKKEYKTSQKYERVLEDVEEEDPALEIINEIREYAKNHEKFKTDYLESLVEYLEENSCLTSSQYNSLVKIYYAFHMHEKKQT